MDIELRRTVWMVLGARRCAPAAPRLLVRMRDMLCAIELGLR